MKLWLSELPKAARALSLLAATVVHHVKCITSNVLMSGQAVQVDGRTVALAALAQA